MALNSGSRTGPPREPSWSRISILAQTALFPLSWTTSTAHSTFNADDGVDGVELWKSDGTAAGTVMVKDIDPGSDGSFPNSLTNVNGTLYFSADDGTDGFELWKSDGTAAGTVMVKDINPGLGDSAPWDLTNV